MKAFHWHFSMAFVTSVMACCGVTERGTTDGRFVAKYGLNVAVDGTTTASVVTMTASRCAAFCHVDPACVGVNYRKTDDGRPNCNLLAASWAAVVKSDGTFYAKDVVGISTTSDETTAAFTAASLATELELNRTVIAIQRTPLYSCEDLFVRGGNHAGDPISIMVRSLGDSSYFDKYNAWRQDNLYLQWQDPLPSQGLYNGRRALGTPTVKTTNCSGDVGYHGLNVFGSDYWLVDLLMNCSMTSNGWFELKAVVSNLTNPWEPNIEQDMTCRGNAGGSRPDDVINHVGRCGFTNVFQYGENMCEIYYLP